MFSGERKNELVLCRYAHVCRRAILVNLCTSIHAYMPPLLLLAAYQRRRNDLFTAQRAAAMPRVRHGLSDRRTRHKARRCRCRDGTSVRPSQLASNKPKVGLVLSRADANVIQTCRCRQSRPTRQRRSHVNQPNQSDFT